jgi:hypothetical protein
LALGAIPRRGKTPSFIGVLYITASPSPIARADEISRGVYPAPDAGLEMTAIKGLVMRFSLAMSFRPSHPVCHFDAASAAEKSRIMRRQRG